MRKFVAILMVILLLPSFVSAETFNNNVFADFELAKLNDGKKDAFVACYVEMIQTLYNALWKTGRVGTDSFWAAVEALIPSSIYSSHAGGNAQMQAIYNYVNSNLLTSVTLKNDICSYEFSNIEYFVKQGIDCGIFKGDLEDFSLNESMTVTQMCNKLNVTQTYLYVAFTALDMYNTDYYEASFITRVFDKE